MAPMACRWCTREPAWLVGRAIASSSAKDIAGIPWDRVNAVLEDRSGTLWVGIHDGGLIRVRDGHVTHLTKKDGLADDSVLTLFEDRRGSRLGRHPQKRRDADLRRTDDVVVHSATAWRRIT